MKIHKLVLILLIFSIVIGCAQYEGKQSATTAPQEETTPGNTIEISPSGFSPQTLTITIGKTVTFVNKDSIEHWPASGIHPTHALYPESGGCIGSKFDACKGLVPGETFKFTFNENGSWSYHDHLNPSTKGTIVVE